MGKGEGIMRNLRSSELDTTVNFCVIIECMHVSVISFAPLPQSTSLHTSDVSSWSRWTLGRGFAELVARHDHKLLDQEFGYHECARARCRDTGCLRTHAECLEEIFHTSAEISYKGCVTKVLQKIDLIYSVPHGDYQ